MFTHSSCCLCDGNSIVIRWSRVCSKNVTFQDLLIFIVSKKYLNIYFLTVLKIFTTYNTKQNQIEEYFSSDFSQGTLPSERISLLNVVLEVLMLNHGAEFISKLVLQPLN